MMKKICLLLLTLATMHITLNAQTMPGINYQAVIQDESGDPVGDESLTLILSVTTDAEGYNEIYAETHAVTTASNGAVAVKLGEGDVLTDIFAEIDWTTPYYLKLEVDRGSGAEQLGVSAFGAVPYSYVAGAVNDSSWVGDQDELLLHPSRARLGINVDSAHAPLHIGGGNWNLNATEGDFKIGNDMYRLKMGIALGGAGAGHSYIKAQGGNNHLTLGSSTANTLTLAGTSVGINEISPEAALHVYTNSSIGYPQVDLRETGFDYSRLSFSTTAVPRFWTIAANSDTSNTYASRMNFYFHNGTFGKDIFSINANDGIGIGTITPSAMLDIRNKEDINGGVQIIAYDNPSAIWRIDVDNVDETIGFYYQHTIRSYIETDGDYIKVSDLALKDDVQPVQNALEGINRLRPSTYHVNVSRDPSKLSYGFIAQEVEEVYPELVGEHDGLKTLSYTEIIPISVAAIQELQAEICELEETLNRKEEVIYDQNERIANLEAQMHQIMQMLQESETNQKTGAHEEE